MAPWKRLASAGLVAISLALSCVSLPASATSFSIDYSDLWWNTDENGWGLQFTQRNDIIFATLYVYNTSNAPIWYAAILNYSGTSWGGNLMQTTGPWFGTKPFNAATVTVNNVGSMSFTPTSASDGVLSYSVNGVSLTKHIQRATFRYDDYSGTYIGVLAFATDGCANPTDLGMFNNRIEFNITQSGTALSMVSQQQGAAAVCTSSGTYGQDGQFGNTTQTTASCSDGSGAGSVTKYYQMNVTPSGVSMNFTAPSSNPGSKGCNVNGTIVGIRQ